MPLSLSLFFCFWIFQGIGSGDLCFNPPPQFFFHFSEKKGKKELWLFKNLAEAFVIEVVEDRNLVRGFVKVLFI